MGKTATQARAAAIVEPIGIATGRDTVISKAENCASIKNTPLRLAVGERCGAAVFTELQQRQ